MNKITLKEDKPEQKRAPKAGDLLTYSSGDDGIFMLAESEPGTWTAINLQDGSFLDTASYPGTLMASNGLEFYRGSVTITTVQSR